MCEDGEEGVCGGGVKGHRSAAVDLLKPETSQLCRETRRLIFGKSRSVNLFTPSAPSPDSALNCHIFTV